MTYDKGFVRVSTGILCQKVYYYNHFAVSLFGAAHEEINKKKEVLLLRCLGPVRHEIFSKISQQMIKALYGLFVFLFQNGNFKG